MVSVILFEGSKAIAEACGIRGGKLFHVVIVLGKKLYLNVGLSMFVWYGWKPRGVHGSFLILVG